ncbi:putative zinc-binding oxidoreductase [Crocosphaera subtropica ATCC 51142]|uniref:Zinc-binding oxidoreductase n=1 Tax=Crocosphaera subtropica (strain ATCC 51142 / BH68) TaxID=43989 RepID=B1WWF9_CROS5|nr:NAD(P)-dependent alcohol dehydrogenase [Crocosphaera subtropica]ACB54087.1 putative zinc-binding oxidoreductase [Crocosphaera subtropica ATCC 51142]
MKSVIFNRYGSPDVLEYAEVTKPSPTAKQLLIKVIASSVNPIDWKIRRGMLQVVTGKKFPLSLGCDFSGEAVEVGEKVSDFQVSDQVYGFFSPGSGKAYGEYIVITPQNIAPKPTNLTHSQAAAVPLAASTALQGLRNKGKVKRGQTVLINGASGGVGTFAVQIAKAYQAAVTGVCSGKNIPLVTELGADYTIDYTQEDFTQQEKQYDIIFDIVGNYSFRKCQKSLNPEGIYVTLTPSLNFIINSVFAFFSRQQSKLLLVEPQPKDLAELKDLIEHQKVKPIIDCTYQLSDIMAAHTYSETGHVVGKIVLEV